MIRRAFWLGAGAAAGIMGYRRVEAIGRKVTGRIPGTVTGASLQKAGLQKAGLQKAGRKAGRPAALRMARETMRFTRDVREGMEIYSARQNRPAASNLSKQTPIAKDGR